MRPEHWFKKFSFWTRSLLHRSEIDRDLDDELAYHLEAKMLENIAKGMPPDEARRAARIELGGVEQVKENVRSIRAGAWLETFLQDIRFGLRILRKKPGFAGVAVLTLALGIGANTALFSLVDAVLLNPLPYFQPDHLAAVYARYGEFNHSSVSYLNFLDWVRSNRSFSSLAGFRADSFNMTGRGRARTPARGDGLSQFLRCAWREAHHRSFFPPARRPTWRRTGCTDHRRLLETQIWRLA